MLCIVISNSLLPWIVTGVRGAWPITTQSIVQPWRIRSHVNFFDAINDYIGLKSAGDGISDSLEYLFLMNFAGTPAHTS